MNPPLALFPRLVEVCPSPPVGLVPLAGGCVGEVYRCELADGSRLVVKSAGAGGTLHIEGLMLGYLAEHSTLPVPRVIHSEPALLVMEHVESDGRFTDPFERHGAELLAALHGVRGPHFGFDQDTLIGSLHQPCPAGDSWVEFFREHRLLYMAREASRSGRLPGELLKRIESVAGRLTGFLDEPEFPSLIHGDVWSGNVLARDGRVGAFIDPAIYFAHPEIELAFITLFSTFGRVFFDGYSELCPIRPGFFELRRHVYNLYPLLVHARLFGGAYVDQIAESLESFG